MASCSSMLERLAVPLGLGELGEQVVARVGDPVLQLLGEVLAELDDLVDAVPRPRTPCADSSDISMKASDHTRKSSRSSIGTPSISAIMIIGNGAATVSTKSTSTSSGIWSNRSDGDPLHLVLELADRPGGEGVAGDLAQEAVALAVGHHEVVGVQRTERLDLAQLGTPGDARAGRCWARRRPARRAAAT